MKKKRIIATGIGVFIIILSAGIFAIVRDLPYMRDVHPSGIDLSSIGDGSHAGIFEHGRFSNKLTVHIAGGRIMSINIDDDLFGGSVQNVSGEVFGRVISAQDTRIDAVSGSTATTAAYLRAIEDALRKGAGR